MSDTVTGPVEGDKQVQIFDTTLRDGEQSPGISLNAEEKLEIAQQLARLGVDVIEAGFPIASPGDFAAVRTIAQKVEGPTICGLARAIAGDIDRAWEAIRDAAKPRIHTFISTSDIHIEHQMQSDRESVKKQAREAVARARSLCEEVEFSPMDATRADVEYTAEVCAIAVEEGATVINIPDTVGYTVPDEYARYFEDLYRYAPSLRDVRLSVHCHDDLGLAVANSYAGVLAGARQVECAINGLGERAGNCSLEEIVMLLRTRRDAHDGLDTNINTRELARTSRLVSRFTGYAVQPNKAIVGRNAFAHESGIHQDGVLKERTTFEIMDAREVGFDSNQLVLGKHSGRHALQDALEQLGVHLEGEALKKAFVQFKEIADRKKTVTALDLEAIVSDQVRNSRPDESYELVWFDVEASSRKEPRAEVCVRKPGGGEESTAVAGGDGPVDAIFQAIQDAAGVEAELIRYEVSAVDAGDDALGEVTVVLKIDGFTASGQGVSTDILDSSARAYVRAMSNAIRQAATGEHEIASSTGP